MNCIHQQLAAELRHEQAAAWDILAGASEALSAAELLEARLREAGFPASAQGHLDEHGCVALVFVQAPRLNVLHWLDGNAVPCQPVSCVDTERLVVHTYAVHVCGHEVSLAVCEPLTCCAQS